ncbi:unnamed protein product [Gordionus sp. m RMFG-2023]
MGKPPQARASIVDFPLVWPLAHLYVLGNVYIFRFCTGTMLRGHCSAFCPNSLHRLAGGVEGGDHHGI